MNEVKKLSANDHQVTEIESIFSDESIVNPFLGLETQYKQDQFIASHFNYVVKKLIIIEVIFNCFNIYI